MYKLSLGLWLGFKPLLGLVLVMRNSLGLDFEFRVRIRSRGRIHFMIRFGLNLGFGFELELMLGLLSLLGLCYGFELSSLSG